MGKKIVLDKVYLDETIGVSFRGLVGEMMKRFELFSDKEDIKKECKELAYEKMRDLKAQLSAFDCGVRFVSASHSSQKDE